MVIICAVTFNIDRGICCTVSVISLQFSLMIAGLTWFASFCKPLSDGGITFTALNKSQSPDGPTAFLLSDTWIPKFGAAERQPCLFGETIYLFHSHISYNEDTSSSKGHVIHIYHCPIVIIITAMSHVMMECCIEKLQCLPVME